MSEIRKLIHIDEDDLGRIYVYDKKDRRYLSFGGVLQQSCINIRAPHKLTYDYPRAMVLASVLMPTMGNCLVAGLGGGSLIHFIRRYLSECNIHVVEYRQAVIDIAKQFFFIGEQQQLTIECCDFESYLDLNDREQFDVVFMDLYTDEGMHEQQKKLTVYESALRALTRDGVLVMNIEKNDYAAETKIIAELERVSGNKCIKAPLVDGNIIVFAFKGARPLLGSADVSIAVECLEKKTRVSFEYLFGRLQVVE